MDLHKKSNHFFIILALIELFSRYCFNITEIAQIHKWEILDVDEMQTSSALQFFFPGPGVLNHLP